MTTVSIIGVGRLGGALAIALSRTGFVIERLVYRNSPPQASLLSEIFGTPELSRFADFNALTSDILFITTADSEIRGVAQSIVSRLAPETVVLHASGPLSSAILDILPNAAGSMHPLLSVSDPAVASGKFSGAHFCVEGGPSAVACAIKIVLALGGKSFTIDTKFKPLYHAAAVMAAGHIVALTKAAADMLGRCGLEEPIAMEVLNPLINSTVANLSLHQASAALTGPFARTDLEVISRHIHAFGAGGLELEKQIYLDLGLKSLELAEKAGGDIEKIKSIADAIKLAQVLGK